MRCTVASPIPEFKFIGPMQAREDPGAFVSHKVDAKSVFLFACKSDLDFRRVAPLAVFDRVADEKVADQLSHSLVRGHDPPEM